MPLRPTLQRLFPPAVCGAELVDFAQAEPLWPEEAAHLVRAVPKRAAEFRAGRHCARAALRELGRAPAAIGVAGRAPAWPAGVVGAITHAEGYCAAVVGEAQRFAGLGFDCERIGRVSSAIWMRIAAPDERARPEPSPEERTLVFSAKEALYKAQFAVTGAWLGFEDASAERVADDALALRLTRDVPGVGARGTLITARVAMEGTLAFAAVTLPRAAAQ